MNPVFSTYRRRPCLALLGALGSLLCATISAQNSVPHPTTAVLQGTVRTPAGEPVAEAVVVVTSGAAVSSAETASSAETKTDAAGAFLFPSVVPGEYAVTAKKLGWNARPPISLKISQGENPPLTLILESQSAKSVATTSGAIEFDDKPNFTVAGLTDWNNVSMPPSNVLSDISNGQLAQVSWVVPSGDASDHANGNIGLGPSWVASIVNAIGSSAYWQDTAIFITWDDWGGWYDHVAPPILNSYEYGFRVPLIVVSPYAKPAYISHVTHDFGSILQFIEHTYNLPSLGYADATATSLSDCFNFKQKPLAYKTIAAPVAPSYFLNSADTSDPDDD